MQEATLDEEIVEINESYFGKVNILRRVIGNVRSVLIMEPRARLRNSTGLNDCIFISDILNIFIFEYLT